MQLFNRLLPLSFLAVLMFGGCKKTDTQPDTVVRSTSDFNKIALSGETELDITAGPVSSIEVSGRKTDLDELQLRVKDGQLSYTFSRKRSSRGKLRFKIVNPELVGLDLSGDTEARINDFDQKATFSYRASGNSRTTLNRVRYNGINAEASGNNKLYLNGNADELRVTMSGNSELEAGNLPVNNCYITASGNCKGTVRPHILLDVTASGNAHIKYYGRPQTRINVSGGATVENL